MPITTVDKDVDALTLTVVGDFAVSKQRLWEAWADPRQLERFWGPPTWPATFTQHDMFPGGRSAYVMTGPDGSRSAGYWVFLDVDNGQSFSVRDGFAHDDGTPNDDIPSCVMHLTFHDTDGGSRFRCVTTFPSLAALEQLIGMGMMEGMTEALGQLETVLADLASFASDLVTQAQLLSDTQVRVSRVIRGSVADVWRAHHEPELLRKWMTGPDGWRLTTCEVPAAPGDRYRYEWESDSGQPGFGFTGELLEWRAPNWAVTTEAMIGTEDAADTSTRNDLTLTPVAGGTLMSLVITYPSKELRDMILGTGMVGGMEISYARLEDAVLAA
jgi:uncharacterized protein YndB with AHSA1/START domain